MKIIRHIAAVAGFSALSLALSYAQSNNELMYLGRIDPQNQQQLSNWSGSEIALNVEPTSKNASLQINMTSVNLNKYPNFNVVFGVYIYDQSAFRYLTTTNGEKKLESITINHDGQNNQVTTKINIDFSKLAPNEINVNQKYIIELVQLNDPNYELNGYVTASISNPQNITILPYNGISNMNKVVFYGDSITAGYQDATQQSDIAASYAFQTVKILEQQKTNHYPIINASYIALPGITVSKTPFWPEGMSAYYNNLIYNGEMNHMPMETDNYAKIAVINLGTNDVLHNVTPGEYYNSLASFIDKIHLLHPNATIVLDLWGFDPSFYPNTYYDEEAKLTSQGVCATPGIPFTGSLGSVNCFKDTNTGSHQTNGAHPTQAYAIQHAQRLSAYLETIQ